MEEPPFKAIGENIAAKKNEYVRKLVLDHKDNNYVIAERAGITPEALSNFTSGHSDLLHANIYSVLLSAGGNIAELHRHAEEILT